jgi:transcriptional regulator with XRE-family HTH domain
VDTRRRTRNDALRTLLNEAGWTQQNLARSVNEIARAAGVDLHYDRTTVCHWLSGSRPRPPVPAFVAEALTRRLQRPVATAETGLAGPSDGQITLPEDNPATEELIQLLRLDLHPSRRAVLRNLPYRLEWAVAETPSQDAEPACAHSAVLPVDHGQIQAVRAMATIFFQADGAFGGGHIRRAVAAYVADDVAGLVHTTRSAIGRREVQRATAALIYLLGFMSFDNLHHNLAQRYFRIAHRMAVESDDRTTQALVLRAMSKQALFLGHLAPAVRLADSAVQRAGEAAPAAVQATLLGQAAVAHAAAAHHQFALDLLAEADRYLDRATSTTTGIGSADRADLTHHAGEVFTFVRDLPAAVQALRDSLRLRTPAHRRSRMLTACHLTNVLLRGGQFVEACTVWHQFLDEYPYVRSGRLTTSLLAVRGQLAPHRAKRVVRETLHRMNEIHR